jgi:NADH:ubiquinone oxidoreductase subunit 5 (subunit L)/multisubunit Na+/H+ antiporter MnhA subunit
VLLAKTAFLIVAAPVAPAAAAILGGLTAAAGATIALVRPEAKRRLGWSTVAQMGFMVLQCGCGAFAAAIVHLVAHGGYKSAAFLGVAGSIDAHAPAQARIAPRAVLHPAVHACLALVPATLGVLAAGALFPERILALPAAPLTLSFAWASAVVAARQAAEHGHDRATRTIVGAGIAAGVAVYLAIVVLLDGWLGARLPHVTFVPATIVAAACALVAGMLAGLGLRLPPSERLYAIAVTEGRGVAAVPAS